MLKQQNRYCYYTLKHGGNTVEKDLENIKQKHTQSGRKVVKDVAQLSSICEQNSGTAVSFGPFPSSQTYRAIWPNKDGY